MPNVGALTATEHEEEQDVNHNRLLVNCQSLQFAIWELRYRKRPRLWSQLIHPIRSE